MTWYTGQIVWPVGWCPTDLGGIPDGPWPALTPDLTQLVIRESGMIDWYSWPEAVYGGQAPSAVSDGQQHDVDDTYTYVHVGFNLRRYGHFEGAFDTIGTTLSNGAGLARPVQLAGGTIYLLSDTNPAELWAYSTSGSAGDGGTLAATFTGYSNATRPFYSDGDLIYLTLDDGSEYRLVRFDTSTSDIDDLGAFDFLIGVLPDGSLIESPGGEQSGFLQVVPEPMSKRPLCPSLFREVGGTAPGFSVKRQGDVSVGLIWNGTEFRVLRWDA